LLQQLTTASFDDSTGGLSGFFNATFADRRTSTIDSQIALGLLYAGPFASRPRDEVGVAAGRTHVNGRIAAAEALLNATTRTSGPVQGAEYVGEIFYSAQVATWLQLRPDIQYVYQPGGVAHSTNDVIVGLRLSVIF
jgi:porin